MSFVVSSSFVNLISDDDSDWEKDPAVQSILQQSAAQNSRYIFLH